MISTSVLTTRKFSKLLRFLVEKISQKRVTHNQKSIYIYCGKLMTLKKMKCSEQYMTVIKKSFTFKCLLQN